MNENWVIVHWELWYNPAYLVLKQLCQFLSKWFLLVWSFQWITDPVQNWTEWFIHKSSLTFSWVSPACWLLILYTHKHLPVWNNIRNKITETVPSEKQLLNKCNMWRNSYCKNVRTITHTYFILSLEICLPAWFISNPVCNCQWIWRLGFSGSSVFE